VQVVRLVVLAKRKPPFRAVFPPTSYLQSRLQANWSGRRDSNPRQPAWKLTRACLVPGEQKNRAFETLLRDFNLPRYPPVKPHHMTPRPTRL